VPLPANCPARSHKHVAGQGGAIADPADVRVIQVFGEGVPANPLSSTRGCRIQGRLSGMAIGVSDFGAFIDAPSPAKVLPGLGKFLGPKRMRYEALTTVMGYTTTGLARLRTDLVAEGVARCERAARDALRERAETTTGLVVEVRARIALVQPNTGSATWMPLEQLRLVKATKSAIRPTPSAWRPIQGCKQPIGDQREGSGDRFRVGRTFYVR
jgi:hypothetical protein